MEVRDEEDGTEGGRRDIAFRVDAVSLFLNDIRTLPTFIHFSSSVISHRCKPL